MVKVTTFIQDGYNNGYYVKELIGTDESIVLMPGIVLTGITCINLCKYKPSAIQEHWHLVKFWHRST